MSEKKCDPQKYKPVGKEVARRVQAHAREHVPAPDRSTTNLYMDERELEKGTRIGPRFQPVVLEQDTVVVFVDEQPEANFGHPCRYSLYDAQGHWLKDVKANFPPSPLLPTGTLKVFAEPIASDPEPVSLPGPPSPPCPIVTPAGRRYALLFAGDCQWRHANDLELSYRTLVGQYGFDPQDVFVYVYDGKKDPDEGVFAQQGGGGLRKFPCGDPTYQMPLRGPATAKNLRKALHKLSTLIKPDDLIFIQTDGHGDNDPDPDGVFLCTYPDDNDDDDLGQYHIADLARDLELFKNKPHRALLTVMAQCHSGGFQGTVKNGSHADRTSFCAAAARGKSSYRAPDRPFCRFAIEWLIAQRLHEMDGSAVPSDGDHDGAVEASEAFTFASVPPGADSPQALYLNGGQGIALSASNAVDPQWCALVSPVMEEYWTGMPETEFYEKLNRALPELREAVLPVLEKDARELRKLLTPTIRKICAAAFGKQPTRTAAKVKRNYGSRGQTVRARRR